MLIAICDDQSIFIDMLVNEINNFFYFKKSHVVIDCYSEGLLLLQSPTIYDLIFLDVEMPVLDGFMVAKLIRERELNSLIVFVTAHSELVFNAFEVETFRYIVKPYNIGVIESTLISALKKIELRKKEVIAVELSSKNFVQIRFDDIFCVESEGRYTLVHLKNETLISVMSLKRFELKLSESNFFRTHKSFIVNLKYVSKREIQDLVLQNGNRIPITRLKNKAFQQAFINYIKQV